MKACDGRGSIIEDSGEQVTETLRRLDHGSPDNSDTALMAVY